MICPKCNSDSCVTMPAEIRLYRNGPRTLSHPPVSPSPDIHICTDCGWSEFTIPTTWITDWIKPQPRRAEPQPLVTKQVLRPIPVAVAS